MKKILIMFVLFVLSSLVFAQTGGSSSEKSHDFDKLTFEIELNKRIFLPIEPIFVRFRLSNLTSKALVVERPQFLLHSIVKVTTPAGKTVEVGNLSLGSGGGVNIPGGINCLQPRQSYEEANVPAFDPSIFSESGNYQIQFFLNGIGSNVAEIEIANPQGINKLAFEFLNEHGRDIWFGKIFQDKDGDQLLKTFVERYGESDYGVYAIASLGKYYLFFEKDIDKARAEFEKIRANENPMIANEANKLLADIERKKADLQKLQKQKEKPQ